MLAENLQSQLVFAVVEGFPFCGRVAVQPVKNVFLMCVFVAAEAQEVVLPLCKGFNLIPKLRNATEHLACSAVKQYDRDGINYDCVDIYLREIVREDDNKRNGRYVGHDAAYHLFYCFQCACTHLMYGGVGVMALIVVPFYNPELPV